MLATTAAVSTLAGKPRLLGRCASPATTSTATSTSCHVLSDADSLSPLFLAADDDDDERFDLAALSPIPDFADDSDEDDTDGGDALLSALDCRCYELADAFEATYSARPRLR